MKKDPDEKQDLALMQSRLKKLGKAGTCKYCGAKSNDVAYHEAHCKSNPKN